MPKPRIARGILAVTVAVAACGTAAASSLATSDPPAGAVDHSAEHYTLGTQAVSQGTAEAGAACVASADTSGTVACFTTAAKLGAAGVDALEAGQLPPGYAAMPPGVDRSDLEQRFKKLQLGGALTPPSQVAAASAASHHTTHRRHQVKARAADGYDCNAAYTYVYTDANFGGTTGSEGYTGTNNWQNFSSTYDNKTSSFWANPNWQSRWHDYANGSGAYYGNGDPCRYVQDLRNANMNDGGTANDRFSSFGNW